MFCLRKLPAFDKVIPLFFLLTGGLAANLMDHAFYRISRYILTKKLFCLSADLLETVVNGEQATNIG